MDAKATLDELKDLLVVLTAAGVSRYKSGAVELEFHPVQTTRVIDNARSVLSAGDGVIAGNPYEQLLGGLPRLGPKQAE